MYIVGMVHSFFSAHKPCITPLLDRKNRTWKSPSCFSFSPLLKQKNKSNFKCFFSLVTSNRHHSILKRTRKFSYQDRERIHYHAALTTERREKNKQTIISRDCTFFHVWKKTNEEKIKNGSREYRYKHYTST